MKRHLVIEIALISLLILVVLFSNPLEARGWAFPLRAPAYQGETPPPDLPQASPSTSFTYQGELNQNNIPYNGVCNFQFQLFSASNGTGPLGTQNNLNAVTVTDGLFTVSLDFGNQFNGSERYLKTSVQCTGDPGFTALSPLTTVKPAPYSVSTSALRGNTVSDVTPANGNVLAWNGSQWAPEALPSGRKQYYQTSATFTGNQALTACAAGFHMATLAEIFNTAALDYARTVPGAVQGADSGFGPPYSVTGWIRTGIGSVANNQVGAGNCKLWTSNQVADYGTTVALNPDWLDTVTNISPWAGVTFTCNNARRVWCVQD
jgi:hypothetical protein